MNRKNKSSKRLEQQSLALGLAHAMVPSAPPVRVTRGSRKDVAVSTSRIMFTDVSTSQYKMFRFDAHALSHVGYSCYPNSPAWAFTPTYQMNQGIGPTNTEYVITSYIVEAFETAPLTSRQGRFYVLETNLIVSIDDMRSHPNTYCVDINDPVIHVTVPDSVNDMVFIRNESDNIVMERYLYIAAEGVSTSSRIGFNVTVKYEYVITPSLKGIAAPALPAAPIDTSTQVCSTVSTWNSKPPKEKRSFLSKVGDVFSGVTSALEWGIRTVPLVLSLFGSTNKTGPRKISVVREVNKTSQRTRQRKSSIKKKTPQKKNVRLSGWILRSKSVWVKTDQPTVNKPPALITFDNSIFIELSAFVPEAFKIDAMSKGTLVSDDDLSK